MQISYILVSAIHAPIQQGTCEGYFLDDFILGDAVFVEIHKLLYFINPYIAKGDLF
jgi:hypothetical protein